MPAPLYLQQSFENLSAQIQEYIRQEIERQLADLKKVAPVAEVKAETTEVKNDNIEVSNTIAAGSQNPQLVSAKQILQKIAERKQLVKVQQ